MQVCIPIGLPYRVDAGREHRETVSQIVKLPYDEVVALGKTSDDALTLLLLLDQLSRNIGWGTDYPFTTCDPLAIRLAEHFVSKLGYHKTQPPYKRLWFFMPFVHSESLPHQELAIANFTKECSELREGDWKEFHEMFKMTLEAALKHFDAINKFGRFPSRNTVLKRETTPEEAKYLAEGGVF